MADLKNWAVEGAELSVSAASIKTNPQENIKAGQKESVKKVYTGTISISISNYGSATITNNDGSGNGSITGSSKNKINGNPVVLEGDSTTIVVKGTTGQGTAKTEVVETVTVKIKNAGQSEVKSN